MANGKTKKPSKSAAIREALKATPDKPAAEIAKELKVRPGLVYAVKASMKKKPRKAKGKPGRKPGSKASTNGTPQSANGHLDSAFEFVVKVGGLLQAEQLLGKLKAIKERL